jgi:arsenite/tail-anchored protein-transporting ATPase
VTRIVLYTGKGGVGKTSIAAATALLAAKRGQRTIVLSTDIAHSLADAFDLPLGPEPTKIGNYDVIVVDAAPTGETLRLLSLPEASRWWIERIAPIGRRVSRIGRPMIERMIGVPMPRDEVFAAAERLLARLEQVHRLLADPDQSSVRIVLALEKLSIVEAQRSFTYFHLFGYPSDLVVCNRVLPADQSSDGSFAGLRQAQQRYLPQVEAQYAPVPVRTVPLFDREMIGSERLSEIGEALFDTADPTGFFYRGRPYQVRSVEGGHVLEVALPFTQRDDVQLSRSGDELLLQVGGWRRSIVLPRALVDAPTTGAKMEDGILRITFRARERATTGGQRR